MEEQPIYPTGSQNIESETAARQAYAGYLRCVQGFGLASEEQFREAQRVRDLGVLDPATGLYLVFKAFCQWIGNNLPPDDWSSNEQIAQLLEAQNENELASMIFGFGNTPEEVARSMNELWGASDKWMESQPKPGDEPTGSPWGNAPINLN